MMTKLVVFDVDGTILDSFSLFEKVLEHYSRENGLPMPCVATIGRGYGDPLNHDFKWGVSREEQKKHLYASFDVADAWSMSGEAGKTPGFFDQVEEALVHFKDLGYTLGIVTSKAEAPLLHLLEFHSMHKYFSGYRTSTDVKRRGEREKPEPDQLLSLMRELKFASDETVMIGDTTMDIHMGRRADTHTIGVTWGTHTRDDLHGAGAHHIVDTHFQDVVTTVTRKIFG